MPIDEAEVAKIAQLAHLEITEDELKAFTPQIAEIVRYVEQLNAIDTANVEPATGGFTKEGAMTDSTTNDVVRPSLGERLALEEAPDPASGYFRVPKIL